MRTAFKRDVYNHVYNLEVFGYPDAGSPLGVHITLSLNDQGRSGWMWFFDIHSPQLMEDLLTASKAMLHIVRTLPDESWANTFAHYSAPECRDLQEAVNSTVSCIEAVERISGQLAN